MFGFLKIGKENKLTFLLVRILGRKISKKMYCYKNGSLVTIRKWRGQYYYHEKRL